MQRAPDPDAVGSAIDDVAVGSPLVTTAWVR
jgi:hypothetical protein